VNNLRRPRWIFIAIFLVLALVVTACVVGGETAPAEPAAVEETGPTESEEQTSTEPEDETPISVNLAADGFLLGSQSWVSIDRGFFEEENIEADVSLFGTGIEAIQAVIARQADLGPALDFAVLNLAAAAEENMRVVGAIAAPKPGFHSLAVRNEINGPEDLVGTKIGYVQGTSEHFVTIRYLEQNGIDLADVELIPFPGLFELVGALRTNDIQAAWVWLSGTQEANEDESLKVLTNDADVLDTVAIYLVASSEWADENQEAITRVLRAYDKASVVLNEEPEAAAQIVADAVSGDAELFANFIPNQRYRVEFTQVQLDSFDAIAQFLIDSGKLPADFDIREFIDFAAMEKAVPGSVTADLDN
jgi:ABC-type nitrate/sulfonate/bicarbonate transport system substrate-binding protein